MWTIFKVFIEFVINIISLHFFGFGFLSLEECWLPDQGLKLQPLHVEVES